MGVRMVLAVLGLVALLMSSSAPAAGAALVREGDHVMRFLVEGPGCTALSSHKTATHTQTIISSDATRVIVEITAGGPFRSTAPFPTQPVPAELRTYTQPSSFIQSDDSRIAALARTLTAGAETQEQAVWAIIAWVIDNVAYDRNAGARDAVTTLGIRRGTCVGISALASALLRASGIPARIVTGRMVGTDTMHDWIEAWYPDAGWVMSDPQLYINFVPPRYIVAGVRTDNGDWPGQLQTLATDLSRARITTLADDDRSRLIDVRAVPVTASVAAGCSCNITGSTLVVALPPLSTNCAVELSLVGGATLAIEPRAGWYAIDWPAAPGSGRVFFEVTNDGTLSVAGLEAATVILRVGSGIDVGRSCRVQLVPGQLTEACLITGAGLCEPIASMSVVSLVGSGTGLPAVGWPADTRVKLYASSGRWYTFQPTTPGRWVLTEGLSGDETEPLTVTSDGRTMRLYGLSPGQYRLTLVTGGAEYDRQFTVVPEGWGIVPIVWWDGGILPLDASLRYWHRMVGLETGVITIEVGDHVIIPDVPPELIDSRVFLPLRAIAEALGAQVDWDPVARTVLVQLDGTAVQLRPGSDVAIVNGVTGPIDTPPMIIGNRVMLPLRFTAEILNRTVDWLPEWRTVVVSQ